MENNLEHIKDIPKLLDFLSPFLSDERLERFNLVSAKRTRHITVAIENINQSHNASAVLRSCDCFGIQDVHIIEKNHAFIPNDDVALGAEKWLNIYKYTNKNPLIDCYKTLKEKGYVIAATSPHAQSISIENISVEKPIALIFGTEKDGLSDEAINNADICVSLPMNGFTESYNISVSVALFLQKTIDTALKYKHLKYISKKEKDLLLVQWCMKSIRSSEKLLKKFEDIR